MVINAFNPQYKQEYYAVDGSNLYEGYKVRTMVWLGVEQNKIDLKNANVFKTYEEVFDIISDY